MDQEDDGRGLNQTGKSLGASHAVADAAASAEALCRTLDSAKISSMAADLRATAAGPTMLKTKSPEDGRSQRSTSSSALLQEQEEEERRLTALSPEVAEFDLSRLRGTKAPTEEGGDKHRKGKKHHNHHGHGGGMVGNDDAHGHEGTHGQHGQGHHGGDHQFGGGPAYHSGGGGNHHHGGGHKQDDEGDADLANLAELVPGLRSRAGTLEEAAGLEGLNEEGDGGDEDRMGMGDRDYNEGREDERKMPAAASGQRSQRRDGGGNRWSTQTRRPESPERNTRDGGGGPGSPDASPQQRAGRIDNLDSMNVGVGHSRSAEEGDPHLGIGDSGSDDDDVANALAAGAAAGLAGVVEADKAREAAEDGDSNSNESLVTRDDAEPMPGEEPGEYDDLSGFGPDKDGDHSSSSSRSSAGNDNGNSSSNNNTNTSESVQRSAAANRKGNKVKKHLRKSRNKNQHNQNQPSPHDGGPAPKAPEHSSDGAIGGPTYHSHGGGSGHDGGGRASPHQHQLTEPRLPPAPEPALHEYGAAASASAGTASGRDRAGRPVPLSGQSVASLSTQTATQTHEVRMPMYLPTFKPATGCTNASDFIVRCFVARLRSGITVVKHGRSRWCKSRLRILHVHSDGRSLTWKPALGEPSSSKRPPKLDLSTCQEVRHAWSPDPLNPMFTGTPILRQKCEAANAHKSFALVFPKRTVDITAVTADQCKVLMEGFSALCFRLQVANLAGKGGAAPGAGDKKGSGRTGKSEQSEEDRTTASVTLTNTSRADLSPTARGGQGQGGSAGNAVGTGDRNRASRHYR